MNELREVRRPVVEILLVAELAVFDPIETPLEALLLPPQSDRLARVPDEGHELHAVLAARRRLVGGLRELVLAGLPTNQKYLVDTLESDFFTQGETFTTTLETRPWTPPEPARAMLVAAATATPEAAPKGGSSGPWKSAGAWRLGS